MRIQTITKKLPSAVLAVLLTAGAAVALEFNTPGATVADSLDGTNAITIGYGPTDAPATLTGAITGATGDVLTVTAPAAGTLNLRGDNTGFLGTVNLASGFLNVASSANLFGQMSSFRFTGSSFDADSRGLQVAAGSAVTIDGGGGATQRMSVIADSGGVFRLQDGASLTFANSRINSGGGALYVNQGAVVRMDAADDARYYFTNNAATSGAGGAIAVQGADFTGRNMTFSGNMSSYGMGGAFSSSTISGVSSMVSLTNSLFTNNSTINDGGAVSVSATVGVANTFSGDYLTFTGNSAASGQGGALRNGGGTVTLTHSSFSENVGRDGGAIYNNNVLYVIDAEFRNNRANRHGGAAFSYLNSNATLTVAMTFDRVSFINNSAGTNRGGAIYSQNTILTLRDANFIGNTAGWQGGAVLAWDSDVRLEVGSDTTVTYEGNRDDDIADLANSYYFSVSGRASSMDVTVGNRSTLDMKDPMRGAITRNTLDIVKNGPGRWNLGGENRFTAPTGGARFTVDAGMLYLYREGETTNGAEDVLAGRINLTGANSSFTVDGAYLGVGGGNAITITDTIGDPAAGTAQGTITLANATLGMNLAGADNATAMLSLKANEITITGGITIDLMSAPSGSYLLVTKQNNSGDNFAPDQVTLTMGGNTLDQITRGGPGDVALQVTDDEIRLTSQLNNTVVSWNGTPAASAWNVTDVNWTDSGGASAFLHGDVVNFNNDASAGAVAIQDNGVTVAGMYVSGAQDYTFTGGPIVAAASSSLTGDAVSGKLVLGGNATAAATAEDANYTGTVDFTGISGANQFAEGVDIRGGTLVVATTGQLGTGLANLTFVDSMLNKTLRGEGDLAFDGAGGTGQRLAVDTGATIEMTDDNSFSISNSATATDGAAISVGTNGELSLESGTGSFTFADNRTTTNGGAVANEGNARHQQRRVPEQPGGRRRRRDL